MARYKAQRLPSRRWFDVDGRPVSVRFEKVDGQPMIKFVWFVHLPKDSEGWEGIHDAWLTVQAFAKRIGGAHDQGDGAVVILEQNNEAPVEKRAEVALSFETAHAIERAARKFFGLWPPTGERPN